MRILFPFIAQPHQIAHSLPIAMEIARRHPEIAVHIACLTDEQEAYIRRLGGFYPDSHVIYERLTLPRLLRRQLTHRGPSVLTRLAALFFNKNYFETFQAIVVPERTSLYLRRMGVRSPRLIWTRHGAGDRAVGFAQDVRHFDFILMAGRKLEKRLLSQGSLRAGHYVTGVYAKFDLVRLMHSNAAPLFSNGRPTVLYNPHFNARLTSWYKLGTQVLDYFATQDRYNLVFAPHYRLFDAHRDKAASILRAYEGIPLMLIDPGSTRSVDMTYTMGADLYLGDVSSQVAEFLIEPRPCLFLDAHETKWHDNPDYLFWSLGPVIDTAASLDQALDGAVAGHPGFLDQQKSYIRETFGLADIEPTAPIGAAAIVEFLRKAH